LRSTRRASALHDAPDGRKITLAISWLPASGEAEPDPIFMLAGGPGHQDLAQGEASLPPIGLGAGVRRDQIRCRV
jgi:hypothetical protein